MEKKWFACKAKQEREVQIYVEAENLEAAKEKIKNGDWDDMDIMDEDDGVKDIDVDNLVEVPTDVEETE